MLPTPPPFFAWRNRPQALSLDIAKCPLVLGHSRNVHREESHSSNTLLVGFACVNVLWKA